MTHVPEEQAISLEVVVRASGLDYHALLTQASEGTIRLSVRLTREEMQLLLSRPEQTVLKEDPLGGSDLIVGPFDNRHDCWVFIPGHPSPDEEARSTGPWYADIRPVAWDLAQDCAHRNPRGTVASAYVNATLRIMRDRRARSQPRPVRLNEVVMLREDYIVAGFDPRRLIEHDLSERPQETERNASRLGRRGMVSGLASQTVNWRPAIPSSLGPTPPAEVAHSEEHQLTPTGRETLQRMLGLLAMLVAREAVTDDDVAPFGASDDPSVREIVKGALELHPGTSPRGVSNSSFEAQINAGLKLISGKSRTRGAKPGSR